MTSQNLKPAHQTNVIGQLLDAKDSVAYCTECLSHDMELWERKEYEAIIEDSREILKNLKAYIIENKALFNDILSNYNMCVSIFINKYVLPAL